MPPKTIADIDPKLRSVREELDTLAVVKNDMATDAYNVQDEETRAAIDRVVATLRLHATGYVAVKVGGTMHNLKLSDETLGYSLFYLAVEIVKDMRWVGLRVGSFEWPESLCADCGEVLTEKKVHRAKGRKRA